MFNQNYCASKQQILPEFLCEKEVDRLIDGVDNLRDKVILETLYSTGCRPKELRSFKISAIDFNTREIRAFGKNGRGEYVKERIILFTKRARDLIQQYLPTRRARIGYEDILFLNDEGEGLSAKELNKMVAEHIFNILHRKIKRSNPAYILRHSFATAMLNREVDLCYISKYLGHDNISSSQAYTHIAIDHLKEQFKKYHPRENPKYIAPYCKEPEWVNKAIIPKDTLEWARGILGV